MSRPRLYDLLPAYVRYRDALEGEPLRSVMSALQIPFDALHEDIAALYDDWFIETCEEWLIPYIGDLVGVRGLNDPRHLVPTQRTRVANTLAYRRAKGTLAVVERVSRDVTGWPCRLSELRQTLTAVPSVEDPGFDRARSADLRRDLDLDRLGGPFNVIGHSLDLKPASDSDPPVDDSGGFHPRVVSLAFWRLEAYPVYAGTPHPRDIPGAGAETGRAFTFNPFGLDAPLFNPPCTADGAVYASEERNLPVALRSLPLADETEAARAGRTETEGFLGSDPAFRIRWSARPDGELATVSPAEMEISDLTHWAPDDGPGGGRVRVDPVLGRFLFADEKPGRRVLVDYSYGAAMDLGGGPYPRPSGPMPPVPITWRAVVARGCERRFDGEAGIHYFPSLTEALEAWGAGRSLPIPPPRRLTSVPQAGEIRIADGAAYEVRSRVQLDGRCLVIRASDGCSPLLRGELAVTGSRSRVIDVSRRGAGASREEPLRQNELYLQGLWIAGGVRLTGGGSLYVDHCTIAPPRPGDRSPCAVRFEDRRGEETGGRSVVVARRSILGALRPGDRTAEIALHECLVDPGEEGVAVLGGHTALTLDCCTVFGEVRVDRLPSARGTLFTAPVKVAQPNEGAVRFSHLPAGSVVPPQDRCVGAGSTGPAAAAVPAFTSTTYGDPGYAQLTPGASPELRTGGEDGNEIGVYNALRQADRLANLPVALAEFLPWGIEARVSFVT